MASCKNCVHCEACDISAVYFGGTIGSEEFRKYEKRTNVEFDCEQFKDRTRFIELPCKIGSEVFVTPDRGKHFHKATLYGRDKKGTYLVFVNDRNLTDEEKRIVANPCTHSFYGWFLKVYTKEEAKKALEGVQ